jgi:hypothetical protein
MGRLRQKQPRLVLNQEEYDQLKARVLDRDGWKCQSCGTQQTCKYTISYGAVSWGQTH